ncbi:MAG: SnoaL-like domain-containing protein [Lysobacter sp.]|nr:SnoaL-like domain-containing protein [Lysobacter sp.]
MATARPDLKERAVDFLRMAASGQAREAFARFAAPGFRHHNPWFADGADTLAAAMDENAAAHPGKQLDIQRVLRDGDLVAIHSRVRMQPSDRGIAVVHILRFEDGRLAELWDIGQPVPEQSPNGAGMF